MKHFEQRQQQKRQSMTLSNTIDSFSISAFHFEGDPVLQRFYSLFCIQPVFLQLSLSWIHFSSLRLRSSIPHIISALETTLPLMTTTQFEIPPSKYLSRSSTSSPDLRTSYSAIKAGLAAAVSNTATPRHSTSSTSSLSR